MTRRLWTEKKDVKLGCELQTLMDQRGIDMLDAGTVAATNEYGLATALRPG